MKKIDYVILIIFLFAITSLGCRYHTKDETLELMAEKTNEDDSSIITDDIVKDEVDKEAERYDLDLNKIKEEVFYNFDDREKVLLSSEDKNICFIGNSLTIEGDMIQYFNTVLEQQKKDVTVNTVIRLGADLSMIYKKINEDKELLDKVTNADVIILQEYGTRYDNTEEAVNQIRALCKPNCKCYFLITDFNIYTELDLILNPYTDIIPLPVGYIGDLLIKHNIFNFASLHQGNDYHPNKLYGYFEALIIYESFFGEKVEGFDYSNIPLYWNMRIPGETEEEKDLSMKMVQRIIDVYCQWYCEENRVTTENPDYVWWLDLYQ